MKFSSEKIFWFLYAGIAVYALYCYNPFALFFQNDDFIHIPLSRDSVLFQRNSFRPVCDLSVMFDFYLYNKNAGGYHLTNLLLHIVCSLLVFLFGRKIIEKYFRELDPKRIPGIVALLFFVYATHSEAILWILGRSAIIGLIFSLLFLLQYLKREANFSSIIKYLLFFFLALLSYESSFILPVLSILFLFVNRSKKDSIHVLIVFVSFFIYLAARVYVTGEIYGAYEVNNIGQSGLVTVIVNFGKLLMRSFIPAYTQGIFVVILFSLIVVTVFVLLIKNSKPKKLIVLSGVFIVSLLPYCSLGIDAHGYEGERYLYFPAFFLCLLMVLTISQTIKKQSQAHLLFLFILFIHCSSLFMSAKNFRIAGNVNKLIIYAINSIKAIDTLNVEELPQAQNGALIMRDGFKEAVTWLKEGDSISNIVISSKRSELKPLSKNYKLIYRDSLFNNRGAYSSIEKKTIRFYFSDSALFIKQQLLP